MIRNCEGYSILSPSLETKDDLRAMMHSSHHTKANEKMVLTIRDAVIAEALSAGKNVIIDDTNLSDKHYNRIRNIIGPDVKIQYNDTFLAVPVEECIRRDLARPNSVGEKVIRKMHRQFFGSQSVTAPAFDASLPSCIICDMDGTLSLMGDRSPYDARTCDQDEPNWPVLNAVSHHLKSLESSYPDCRIELYVFSGRENVWVDDHKDVEHLTTSWLHKYGLNPTLVSLRKEGDQRKDAVIKKEMYDKLILNKANVLAVYDDRNSVVSMWRSLGLPCFQVADGDF